MPLTEPELKQRQKELTDDLRVWLNANKAELLRRIRKRWPHIREDALVDVHTRILRRIWAEDVTEAALAAVADAMTSLNYWVQAMVNWNTDQYRFHNRVVGHDADGREIREHAFSIDQLIAAGGDPVPMRGPDPTADLAIARVDGERSMRALSNVLWCLTEQDELQSVRISEAAWTVLHAYCQAIRDRAKVRGLQAEIARELGLGQATVSEHLKNAKTAISVTRYLCGVLAKPRTLTDKDVVKKHLDEFEKVRNDRPEEAAILQISAAAVQRNEDLGTRVYWPEEGTPLRNKFRFEEAELHTAETLFAKQVKNEYPACVTICTPHNPIKERHTEF